MIDLQQRGRSSCREKCILESGLKRAGLGFANGKPGTNRRLSRAKKFDVDLAGLAKRTPDCFERELGRVAVPAEMSEHDAIDFSGKQFFDHGRRGVVGKMT